MLAPIFLIVGAPAVGKSTLSKAIALSFEKSIHVSVDDLRDMVVSGYIMPSPEWPAAIVEQLGLARETAVHIARTYQPAGFTVVIDDFYDPNHLIEYEALDDRWPVNKILLYPDQAAAHARNFQRSGGDAYIDDGIRLVYNSLQGQAHALKARGWLVLDTTSMTVEETAAEIIAVFESRPLQSF